jgi:uncharacterized membrane protein
MTLLIHIAAGMLALGAGAVALSAAKGGTLHRRSGMLFVVSMLTMAVLGMLIAAVRNVAPSINIPAAITTAYLVVTALTTVRPPSPLVQRVDTAAMLVALPVGIVCFMIGFGAIAAGGSRAGMAFPMFMFGSIGLFGGMSDLRRIRAGRLQGTPRLVRHLWRMCFALFIAVMSFFLGQAKVFPEPVRSSGVLAFPIVAVFVTMLYWLWRVRHRPASRGVVGTHLQEAM